jgi:hypothetical protein
MCDEPIELSVVVQPHGIPHPCLVMIAVVNTSNDLRAPLVTKASRFFGITDEDRLPKVLAGGIPSYIDG